MPAAQPEVPPTAPLTDQSTGILDIPAPTPVPLTPSDDEQEGVPPVAPGHQEAQLIASSDEEPPVTPLAADVDLRAVATRTERFTGAELRGVIREAALAALRASPKRSPRFLL